MSEERIRILRMLEEGKITAEDAERLLRAIDDSSMGRSRRSGGESKHRGSGFTDFAFDWTTDFGEFGRKFAGKVGGVIKNLFEGFDLEDFPAAFHWGDRPHGRIKGFDSRELSVPLEDGVRTVAIKHRHGAITVLGEERNDVAIKASIEVRAQSKERAEEIAKQVTIRHEREDDQIHLRHSAGDDLKCKIDYELLVPQQLGLDLSSMSGTIHVSSTQGQIRVKVMRGDIRIKNVQSNQILARSLSGAIEADVELADAANVKLKTTDGSVHLRVPNSTVARVMAKTLDGKIDCSLPLNEVERSRRYLKGVIIGSGDDDASEDPRTSIELSAGSGNLNIHAL